MKDFGSDALPFRLHWMQNFPRRIHAWENASARYLGGMKNPFRMHGS